MLPLVRRATTFGNNRDDTTGDHGTGGPFAGGHLSISYTKKTRCHLIHSNHPDPTTNLKIAGDDFTRAHAILEDYYQRQLKEALAIIALPVWFMLLMFVRKKVITP